jgi:membrane protein DedA with SNARE-associated domain
MRFPMLHPLRALLLGAGSLEALGLPVAIAILLAMDAGVPIPIPTDLLLILLGVWAGSGLVPFWAAGLGLELVAVGGTGLLFFAARGPGSAVIGRIGPRIGLTSARIDSAARLIERRGWGSLALGRATPGLRTVTVLAAAFARLHPRYALPALFLGSSLFLQAHLVLGYFVGPRAVDVFNAARLPVLILLAVLVVGGVAVWIARRGRRGGPQAWTEASCPACLVIALMTRSSRDDAPMALE